MNLFSHNQTEMPNTDPNTGDTPSSSPQRPHPLTELARFAIIALIVVVPIRLFIAQPFIVSGASMEDTLLNGDYIIVDQLTYQFEDPKRGDVIVFHYPRDISKFFIKRVIGIPGDQISIAGDVVTISNTAHPKGIVLSEPYVDAMQPNTRLSEDLDEGEYFVMGDNRDASSDSRRWGILEEEKIVGRAFIRLFPLTKIDLFPGEYDTDAEIHQTALTSS